MLMPTNTTDFRFVCFSHLSFPSFCCLPNLKIYIIGHFLKERVFLLLLRLRNILYKLLAPNKFDGKIRDNSTFSYFIQSLLYSIYFPAMTPSAFFFQGQEYYYLFLCSHVLCYVLCAPKMNFMTGKLSEEKRYLNQLFKEKLKFRSHLINEISSKAQVNLNISFRMGEKRLQNFHSILFLFGRNSFFSKTSSL